MLLILTLGESAIPKKGEWWKNWAMGMVPQLPKSLEKMQLLKRLLKYPNMERGSARSAKRTNKEKRDLIKGSHRTPSCDWFRKAARLGMIHLLAAWKPWTSMFDAHLEKPLCWLYLVSFWCHPTGYEEGFGHRSQKCITTSVGCLQLSLVKKARASFGSSSLSRLDFKAWARQRFGNEIHL